MKFFVKVPCAFLLFFFIPFLTSVSADDKSKSMKLNELMELSGMVAVMEQSRNKSRTDALKYKEELMRQVKTGLKIKSSEFWKYFETEYQKFVDSLEPTWTVEEAIYKYIELYGAQMTEQEIDKVLEFSKSPVGKKSTSVSNEIVPIWLAFLTKETDEQFKNGLQKFLTNIKLFAIEHKKKQKAEKEI